MTPLQRLQQARQLTLVRSGWCEPEPGEPDVWRQILAPEDGLRLVRDGQAKIVRERGQQILRPA